MIVLRSASRTGPISRELSRRLRWLVCVVMVAFLVLLGRLWQLQIARGKYYFERTRQNVVDELAVSPVRGDMVDRHGAVMATSRPSFNIYGDPDDLDHAAIDRLASILSLDSDERASVERRLARARERKEHRPVVLLEDQDDRRAALVRQASHDLPGVAVADEPFRSYPHGELASHVLGYLNRASAGDLQESGALYGDSDFVGRYGLEKMWEPYLRGKKGLKRFVVNAHREPVEADGFDALLEGRRYVAPEPGHNLVLSIDLEFQRLVEDAVRSHPAAAIAVIDVGTGEVVALVSRPSFDPNVMTGHLTPAHERQLRADPRRPFLDKTLRQHYPPGSTFKVVTALAALEAGVATPEDTFVCPGYHELGGRRFHCTGSHGRLDLVGALQRSCNVYFWRLAEKVGLDKIASTARELGFGEPSGLVINGDVPGRIPDKQFYRDQSGFHIGHTLNASVGQGDVEVTVVQVAVAYAALASGGELYLPQLVRRIESSDGVVVADYPPKLRRSLAIDPSHLAAIKRGLEAAVNVPGGTAYRYARSDKVRFAAKTGTAQVRSVRGRPEGIEGWHPLITHAWVAGYAPADKPRIAFAVLIEHGGSGGVVAGPVAKKLVEGYFELERARSARNGGGR